MGWKSLRASAINSAIAQGQMFASLSSLNLLRTGIGSILDPNHSLEVSSPPAGAEPGVHGQAAVEKW